MRATRVEATGDARRAIGLARDYLVADPVRLNLVWSIMAQRAEVEVPGRYWLLVDDDGADGVLLESPPGYPAAISPVRREQAVALAEAVFGEGHLLAGVAGEAQSAASFAGHWSELVPTGAAVEDTQRLYALGRLVPPAPVPGRLRRAQPPERRLLVSWWSDFQIETGLPRSDVSAAIDQNMATGRLFVWDDDGPRCVARATEPLGSVARIGAVFTPRRWRRRGYAAACVAALCELLSAEEHANAILYAQLSNPGSNGIYRRLGFEAVSEMLSYRFSAPYVPAAREGR